MGKDEQEEKRERTLKKKLGTDIRKKFNSETDPYSKLSKLNEREKPPLTKMH